MHKDQQPRSFAALEEAAQAHPWVKPLYIEPMKAEEERIDTNRLLVQRVRARLSFSDRRLRIHW